MRVLVLGGTGAMGTHLVQNLSQKGIDTVVTTRHSRKPGKNLKYIQGNAKDLVFLEKILDKQWDVVIDFMIYKTEDFKKRVSILLNSTSQYIFLSSARVYANSPQPLTESSSRLLDVSEDEEFLLTDEYSLSKARQENILRNSGQNNWTVIRPYITYSENRFQLGVLEKEEWLYRALHKRTIVFSKDIAAKISTMTYGLDVSKAIMALIGKKQALMDTFHITTNESHKWEKILTLYLEVIEQNIGFKPNVLLQDMDKFIEFHPSKYQINYDRLFNRRFDNSKIAKVIDADDFTPIETGLKNCLAKFIADPKYLIINWKLEALKDKLTNENTSFNEISGIKQKIRYAFYRYFPLQIINKLKKITK